MALPVYWGLVFHLTSFSSEEGKINDGPRARGARGKPGRRRRLAPRLGALARSARAPTTCGCVRGRRAVSALQTWLRGPGMPRLLGVCLLWLGLLLLCQQSGSSRARRLCGRHLLKGIIKLCGDADWSHIGGKAPFTQLPFRATGKVESFVPDRLESSQTTFPAWGRGTRSGKNLNQRHVCSSLYISYPRVCSARW